MRALKVKPHESLCALLRFAQEYGVKEWRKGEHSEIFLGWLPKGMAYAVRAMLRKEARIRIRLWPRKPTAKVPKQSKGTYRPSQSLKYYNACALYAVGQTADDVYALVNILG